MEEQRWDKVKNLLEVSHVELALSLLLNHKLDVRERWGVLTDGQHVYGLVDFLREWKEKLLLLV